MQALGYESDVPFALSLFSDNLAHRYQQAKGKFEIFASADCVARLPQLTRQLFFQIIRLYHEQKIGQTNPIAHLSLPPQNNIS